MSYFLSLSFAFSIGLFAVFCIMQGEIRGAGKEETEIPNNFIGVPVPASEKTLNCQ